MSYDLNQVEQGFSSLANKITAELDTQFSKGRLKGTDYANAYATLMNTILQVIIDVPIKAKQVEEMDKQLVLLNAQIAKTNKEIEFVEKQIEKLNKDIDVEERQIKIQENKEPYEISVLDSQIKITTTQNDILLDEKDIKKSILEQQEKSLEKDYEFKERQIQGFNDKIRSDLFKTQMDTWAMMFSSGLLESKPDIITNDEASTIYNDIKNSIR